MIVAVLVLYVVLLIFYIDIKNSFIYLAEEIKRIEKHIDLPRKEYFDE